MSQKKERKSQRRRQHEKEASERAGGQGRDGAAVVRDGDGADEEPDGWRRAGGGRSGV